MSIPGDDFRAFIGGGSVFRIGVVSISGTIVLAPALEAEGFLSMELYHHQVRAALEPVARERGWAVESLDASSGFWGKQGLRYVGYPRRARAALRSARPSLLHVLDHSSAHLCRVAGPAVVTCHDMAHYEHPELGVAQQALWRWRVAGMKRARRVVTVSAHVARQVEIFLGVPKEKIVVNPNGLSPAFGPGPVDEPVPPALAPWKGRHPLVLHVGSNLGRKNLPVLIRALGLMRKEGWDPVLVKAGAGLADDGLGGELEAAGLQNRVCELGVLDQQQLAVVYRACDVLSFPSLVEGFGWPTIEAQACGLPVVLARATCMEEVGGAGALYHDPHDAGALAGRLKEILGSPEVRAALVERGKANAARFTWSAHAQRLAGVYAEVLGETA